jgi:hypothetical protein
LSVNLADRKQIIHNNLTSFDANIGTDHYLLLSGLVRGGLNYQLQITRLPFPGPEEWAMMLLS